MIALLRLWGVVSLCTIGIAILPLDIAFAQFGPFPVGTTIFVDRHNTRGSEDGTASHPFRTIQAGVNAATPGGIVGVAAGFYPE